MHGTQMPNDLDEWSARRRDLYQTTYNTYTTDKHPCPCGIRTIAAGVRPWTYALDRAATGTGILQYIATQYFVKYLYFLENRYLILNILYEQRGSKIQSNQQLLT
jgi:hypothetical protein